MTTIPRRLGKYELRQQVGRGNVGEVWKAYDLQLRREVAVKIIHTDLQSDPHFLLHFAQEGQNVTALHHTNIVQVHDIAVSHPPQQGSEGLETSAYIVSEYIEGQALTDYINNTSRKGAFPSPAEIVYLFTSLGVAIDYAHQKGVVHGDIKPNNILLDAHNTAQLPVGEPMLTDFALDTLIGSAGGIASPFYISPEQAKGQAANNRSDIYSLGVILYELCTGVQPFHDSSSVAVMMQHINTLPTPPILINPNMPPALSEVILRAMAKDTVTRFQLASLLATAIADAYSLQTTLSPAQRAALAEQEESYSGQPAYNSILGVSQPLPKLPPRMSSQPLPTISRPLPTVSGKQPAIKPAAQAPQQQATTGKLPTPVAHETLNTQPTLSILANQAPTTNRPAERTTRPQQVPPARIVPPPPQPQAPPQIQQPLPPGHRARSRIKDRPLYILIATLILLLLIVGGSIVALLIKTSGSTGAIVGHAFFQDDALGHDDLVRLDLQNVAPPPDGKKYVAWIQENEHTFLPLGTLTVQNGTVSFLYPGNSRHTNLLSLLQRLIITSESGNPAASGPKGPVLFEAHFDTATLQYVKNILYTTPGLPTNAGAITEVINAIKSMDDKVVSIADVLQNTHEYPLAIRQATRIIEIIDGTQFAVKSGDQPPNVLNMLNIPVGLLSSPTQQGYLDTLSHQLDKFQEAVGNNTTQLQHIQHVRNAVIDLKDWIQKMRLYDVQLLKAAHLDDPALIGVALQLKQVAADAYTGRTIPPNTGPLPIQGSAGAYQAYVEGQYMATLDIKQA